jgi:integrase
MSIVEIRFTKALLEKLPLPENTRSYYRDKEKGIALYITKTGVKTFYIRKTVNGRDDKIIIGNYPDLSIENAVKMAEKLKGEIAHGINPKDRKKEIREELTFKELFTEYMERYSKKNKKTWKQDEYEVNRFLNSWFNRKLSLITNADIRKIHEKIKDENGLYQANRVFERIRAIFNKAIEWGYKGANPTAGIKKFREKSRDRFISPTELPNLFKSLEEEANMDFRDFFYIALFTGARKDNVLSMKWKDIDLETKVWKIPQTKNGESQRVVLSSHALAVLKERSSNKGNEEFVFPSQLSKAGHLVEPKGAWKRILKRAELEDLRLHDLRRTLGSFLAMSGASNYIIGKALGHKSSKATDVYARLNLDVVQLAYEKASPIFENALSRDNEGIARIKFDNNS